MRIPFISLIAAGSLALGGCAYGDLGGLSVGVSSGSPYYGYGYGSPYGSYGYGSPYGGYGYGSPYFGYGYNSRYGGYPYGGFGYSSPYYGWYDNYYYPGSGYYVYDRYRRARVWSDSQRRYWSTRRQQAVRSGTPAPTRPQWNGFERRSDHSAVRRAERAAERRAERQRRDEQRSD